MKDILLITSNVFVILKKKQKKYEKSASKAIHPQYVDL